MPTACQLQTRARGRIKIDQSVSNVSLQSVEEVLPHSDVTRPFPSSAISNESFMHIDDSWPKETESWSQKGFLSIFSRSKFWICKHKKISLITAILIGLVILTAIIAAVCVTIFRKKGLPCNVTTPTPTSNTTGELSGGLLYASVQNYRFNKSLSSVRLRPDRRVSGGYILTGYSSVTFLESCVNSYHLRTFWRKNEVQICETSELVVNFLFENQSRSCCEVFDVVEECRNSASLCDYSSFIYCCEDSGLGHCFCSIYGLRVENKESIFLDAKFEILTRSDSLFKFSVGTSNWKRSCFMQTQLIVIKNGKVALDVFPSQQCLSDLIDFRNVIDVTVEQNEKDEESGWKAVLTAEGTLHISDFENTLHRVSGLVSDRTSKLHTCSIGENTLIADVSGGLVSIVKVNNSSLAVAQPRCISFIFPGIFVDAFLDDEKLIMYNVDDVFLYIAQLRFFWN